MSKLRARSGVPESKNIWSFFLLFDEGNTVRASLFQSGAILILVLVFTFLVFAGVTSAQEIMPLSEIKKGDRGYGLTVFEGTKPEKFDFEVLGIFDAGSNYYILVELSGGPKDKDGREILQTAKVARGMSGSPMYASDGKIIGALAVASRFALQSKAHVTPIEYMIGPKPKLLYQPNRLIYGENPMVNSVGSDKTGQQPAQQIISPGEVYVFCEYWGDDYSCPAGTVTFQDSRDPTIFYTLGHASGQVGRRALPLWKAEVLTTLARVDSSGKIVRKTGPMLGSVIFNEQFTQIIKLGVMPKFIPMHIILENYFVEPRRLNYFFAYTDNVGRNISSVILNQKSVMASSLDLDGEIRIDIAGQPQVYSRGYLGQTTTAGMVVNEFISDGTAPVIERVNVVLSARPKFKIFELSNFKPSISRNQDGNFLVNGTLIASLGPNRWEKAFSVEVDKSYEGKSIYLSNGESAAEDILTNLGGSSSAVSWLNQVSDRNSLYLYFAEKGAPSSVATEFFLSLGEESLATTVEVNNKSKKTLESPLNSNKHSNETIPLKPATGWQLNNKPQDHFALLAKIELPGPDILITGKKDFVLAPTGIANVPSKTEKKRGFLPFFIKF